MKVRISLLFDWVGVKYGLSSWSKQPKEISYVNAGFAPTYERKE